MMTFTSSRPRSASARPFFVAGGAAFAFSILVTAAQAQLIVAGGLTFDPATGNGYQADYRFLRELYVNDAGVAVGFEHRYDADIRTERAVRWDAGGSAAELGNLGSNFVNVSTISCAN